MEELTHLLVLGAPRSGTTLLACMIARHTEIALLREDLGMTVKKLLSKKVIGNKLCVPNQIEIDRTRVFGRKVFRKVGIFKQSPSSRFCIKDYFRLGNTKIIAIIRDGNDVILSSMKRGNKSFRTSAYRWRRSVQIISDLKSTYGEKVLVLSFEDLVAQPERLMKSVSRFLELPYQEEMLDGYKFSTKYPEAEIVKSKAFSHREKGSELDLPGRFPEVYRQYEQLKALPDVGALAD